MKIAFLNPQGNFDRDDSYLTEHPDFGGQLVYVKEVALALGRLGVEVDVITRRIDDPDWPGFAAPLDDFGEQADRVRIVRLDFGGPQFLPKETLWPHLPVFVDAIRGFYGERMIDYATAHYADGGWAGVLLKQGAGVPFTFTGHSLGAQKIDKLGVDAGNLDAMDARYRFSRRIEAERRAMRGADTVITSTDAERREQYAHPLYHGAIDPADDARFDVIPPGVNERIFHADADGDDPGFAATLAASAPADAPCVVVSSRLDPKKNVGGLVEAWVAEPALHRRARLALFVRGAADPFADDAALGAGERAELAPIRDRVLAAGLRDRVLFVDARSQRQLATAYRHFARAGSVFALPSLFEPFGLAPIEAAACGLAVAATGNGGPSEIFADGSGVLFDPADPADIARGLIEALDRQVELAPAGRERVRARYTWRRTAERYLGRIEANLATPPHRTVDAGSELDALERLTAWVARAR
ncbi:glycosyltransferase family 1 protein [Wenzhouxiangella sp. XN79A]|uniref:glycosyltransferase n=1 Tax=Wenzhouxiangella sp. XN79A TaxID=2724193 RepID=UPI00144AE89A|nr:glycosyltransferase [Wenzhouxiangella sp. XN79A]NKI36545.1 glycosyltransferase family 1 protein [Wenzhouxiangella sp. XN79A]